MREELELESESYFSSPHFVDSLLMFLVNDREFLKEAGHLLTAEDFQKRNKHEGNEQQTVARMSLEFWQRYREPLGKMLRVECREMARHAGMSEDNKKRLFEYAEHLTNGHKRVAATAMLERVRKYKVEHKLALAMQQMSERIRKGTLTQDEFLKIARDASQVEKEIGRPIDIFEDRELERRISRRALQRRRQRYPVLLIDPLDRMVRMIARGHLGLLMAPWKRGKTMFFVWLALSYALQGYNVLFFELEDPKEDMEDRFDAAITALPLSRLGEVPTKLRDRFQHYKRLVRSRIKVVDGTDGATTIGGVESVWEQERNRGVTFDAIIIDYDDEVRPQRKQQERRMEFADIYRDYRSFLGRHSLLGWIATQTNKKSDDLRAISGKHIAEDISKIRKASMALALGQGDWGKDSIYGFVAAHRYDVQYVGANFLTDKDRGLIYDRDRTLAQEKLEREKKEATE